MALKNETCKKDMFYLMNKYSGIVSKIEIEMLLEYLFNCSRLDLYVRDFTIDETAEESYDSLVGCRMKGEPVQHITGRAEFMGLDFIVTRDVLIPRPETEILVNEILVSGNRYQVTGKILDLCTGSGNIAIALAKSIPHAKIVATDISEDILKVAEKNAARHNVGDRIKFYKGDLFSALTFAKNPKFDIIVCNPPYVRKDEIAYLQREVKTEPEIALDGGRDGLDFYRVIAEESHRYLKEGASILLEIGLGQRQAVEDIFSSRDIYEIYRIIEDFNKIQRVIWFKRNTK